jgi:hypothetical protein
LFNSVSDLYFPRCDDLAWDAHIERGGFEVELRKKSDDGKFVLAAARPRLLTKEPNQSSDAYFLTKALDLHKVRRITVFQRFSQVPR